MNLQIGDIVLYQGKEYEVGFIYPARGANWSYHTKEETDGRLRLQNPADRSDGRQQIRGVSPTEVTFVRRPAHD